jgi:hypothetical protein
MKHNCTGAREREMSLMWVCSCGEQVNADEFTEDELKLLKWCVDVAQGHCARKNYDEKYNLVEKLYEKVSKM